MSGSSDELREFTDALRRIEDRLLNSFLVRVSRIYFRWSIWLLGLAAIISMAPFFGYTTEEFVASLPYTTFLMIYFLLAIYLIHFRSEPSIYADSISRLLGKTVDKKQVRLLNRLYIVAWTLPAIIMFPVTYMLVDRWYAWVVALPLFLGTSNLLSFIIDNYVLGIDTRWKNHCLHHVLPSSHHNIHSVKNTRLHHRRNLCINNIIKPNLHGARIPCPRKGTEMTLSSIL